MKRRKHNADVISANEEEDLAADISGYVESIGVGAISQLLIFDEEPPPTPIESTADMTSAEKTSKHRSIGFVIPKLQDSVTPEHALHERRTP